MSDEKMIMNTSDEAAHFKTDISGWVSKDGRFYGKDERAARWDGCTHIACSGGCGVPVSKNSYTVCPECRAKSDIEKYNNLERKEWDGESPLYSEALDRYFFDEQELIDYCYDEGLTTVDDMLLRTTTPQRAFTLSPNDIYCDIMAEEDDENLPKVLEDAFDELNAVIMAENFILSWVPTKYAAILPAKEAE